MDLQHEERLSKVEERSKSNQHRIDDLEKKQDKFDEIVSSINVLATKEQSVENDVKEIKSDVKMLTSKPAKRWDGAVDKILYTAIGIILAYLFKQIGM